MAGHVEAEEAREPEDSQDARGKEKEFCVR